MSHTTRRSFLMGAALALGGGLPVTAAQPPIPIDAMIERERRRIRATMQSDDIAGVAVCLLHQGKAVWTEGFGVTDKDSNRPIGAGTIFSIQSTSKNVTAMAILRAVQHGLLELDEPIDTYLPDFAVQSRFESAPQKKMTLRLLLSHRAGFTHEAPVGNNYDPAYTDFESHVRSIARTWLRHPVGERYRYSNLGVDLAGYILQTVGKAPFADLVKTLIFDPLGMADSTAATEVYAGRENRALGHDRGHAAVPLKTPLIASGGVYTSARDMAAYLACHLDRGRNGGKVILEERLWREMHSFSLGGDYGLGVIREDRRYGNAPIRMFGHKGGGFGFGCVCNYCPQAQLAWIALFNRPADAAYRFGEQLQNEILEGLHGRRRALLPAADLPPIELQSSQIELLLGTYAGRDSLSEMKLDNGILGLATGTAFLPVKFTSPDDMVLSGPLDEASTYRHFQASAGQPAHFECSISEKGLDYNDGPRDAVGPDKADWEPFVGSYQILQWGRRAQLLSVHRKNGHLYLGAIRLIVEGEPGLFFTCDGEAVDFRTEPTWRNIRLYRIGAT
jgi:CubicO group peptidase (beta-lactamase class C family)